MIFKLTACSGWKNVALNRHGLNDADVSDFSFLHRYAPHKPLRDVCSSGVHAQANSRRVRLISCCHISGNRFNHVRRDDYEMLKADGVRGSDSHSIAGI